MTVIHELKFDFQRLGVAPIIPAVQGDGYTRVVSIKLFAGGTSWNIPEGVSAAVRYRKKDGTGGLYDTLPDGNLCWTAENNTITVTLAPQMFTCPGPVGAQVELTQGEKSLSTFGFKILVEASAAADLPDSEDYFSLSRVDMAYQELEKAIAGAETAALAALPGVVDKWLRENPGALTQLPDGSVTADKLSPELLTLLEQTGLSFDSGNVDEAGFLHLTRDGADISGFTPFYVGTGGGGGSAVLRLTTSLPSRSFVLLKEEKTCPVPFSWSSVDPETGLDTGPGTLVWSVNGVTVHRGQTEQGEQSFDLRPYLEDGVDNTAVLALTDSWGNEKRLTVTVTLVEYGLGWSLPGLAHYHDTGVTLRLTPTGPGSKTVLVAVDGTVVATIPVTTTGRELPVEISALSHGAHVITAWMEASYQGQTIVTEPLRHAGAWTRSGKTEPVVAVLEERAALLRFDTLRVHFLAVQPGSETAAVAVSLNGVPLTTLTGVPPTPQQYTRRMDADGDWQLRLTCGNASAAVAVTVQPLPYDVTPVTAGLVLDIDPTGRSNAEALRDRFGYTDGGGVNHPFVFSEDFDWNRGGFRTDSEGAFGFLVPRGSYVQADTSLFADDAPDGKTIKIICRMENVMDASTVGIRSFGGGVGMTVGAKEAVLASRLEKTAVLTCENRRMELDLVMQGGENRMAWICVDAVPSCKPMVLSASDSFRQSQGELLTIGSDSCDVWLYRLKCYRLALSHHSVLQNFIADAPDASEMSRRARRNDIYADDGTISPARLAQNNPGLRCLTLSAHRMTTGKDDVVEADLELRRELDTGTERLQCKGGTFRAQGTSSLEYALAALNLDIDLGAGQLTDGAGVPLSGYKLSDSSIPVTYFNLKADVASSESANNVVLCDDYNTYNPVPFAGKTGGVRDCIEGAPCAVFFRNTSDRAAALGARVVQPGETALYFAGNMNNSKKNHAVFGWDNGRWPEQCCVEVLNNVALPCRFRSDDLSAETWDGAEGTSNFEFAYPKHPTDAMKARFADLLRWVVSTDRDKATGDLLPQPVTWGGVTYATDSPAYRDAKFVHQFDDYFVRDQVLFHYLFTERHCMVDNRAKNTFFCFDHYDGIGYRWSLRRNYDNDTAEGCDNSGGATFTHGLELHDMVGDTYAFNAHDSLLWENIRRLMHEELLRVYKQNKDAWDAERILRKFESYQAQLPEALRMEDMLGKYFAPWLQAGESDFLGRCHGTKKLWREQFERYQGVYFASEYCDLSDRTDAVSLRATTATASGGSLVITPYSDQYVVVLYGTNAAVRIRAKAGVPTAVACPVDSLSDTEVYIFSASNLTDLGDLSGLKTKLLRLSRGRKLRRLCLGSGQPGYQNRNLTELTLGSNPLLQELELRGLPNLTGHLDLSGLHELQALRASGTALTGVTFAPGAPLRELRLPAVKGLTMVGMTELETVSVPGSNLETLWIEGTPAVDALSLAENAPRLRAGRLPNVNWSLPNPDLLLRLAALTGLDSEGGATDRFVLTGSARVAQATEAERDALTEAFPDLTLTVETLVPGYTVTFRMEDGAVLHTQVVRQGAAAADPIAAGFIDVPAKAPSLYEVYTFSGWDKTFGSIQGDTVVTATFTADPRYYTVRFWRDGEQSVLLQESKVLAYGTVAFGGETPPEENGVIFIGWDCPLTNITTDVDIHGVYVTPRLPDKRAVGYDYLFSDDPADVSGYTRDEFWGVLWYGRQRDFFDLGDRIKILCDTNKFTDKTLTLELRSFCHFRKASGSAMAGPYFGMTHLLKQGHTLGGSNAGGFPGSPFFGQLETVYYGGLPLFWRSILERIQTLTTAGNKSTAIVSGQGHLTMESVAELFTVDETSPFRNEVDPEAEEITFACYVSNASRVKAKDGINAQYVLRSPDGNANNAYFSVGTGGALGSYPTVYATSVCFGFCLRQGEGV